ncbi:hypothetical protein GCM10027417_21220 [Glutamicibacter endophyticus]
MSQTPRLPAPGNIIELRHCPKNAWPLGDQRLIAQGSLTAQGELQDATDEPDWMLAVASVEHAGQLPLNEGFERTTTVILGEVLQVLAESPHAVERYRPLRLDAGVPASAELPTGDVLTLQLLTRRGKVRGSVRVLELSKQREQYLFDGQLALLTEGKASFSAGDGTVQELAVRDVLLGGDAAEVRIKGRGMLLLVSLDPDARES